MSLYVIGDTHGNQFLWNETINPFMSTVGKGGMLFVLGDFGVGFWDGPYWSEEMFYDWLAEQPYTVAFVDGNHEDFNKLYALSVEKWNGGKVHKIRSNIIHLMRGEMYGIGGKSIFVMGGGYSIDKLRRKEGYSWWSEEMPSKEEYDNARKNLTAHDNKVDFVLTHTCPAETIAYMSSFPELFIKDTVKEERELTSFLDYVNQTVAYKRWYFGHMHVDRELWRKQYAVYICIRDLLKGEIMRKW